MREYNILLLSEDTRVSASDIEGKIKELRSDDSVITSDDTITVLTSSDAGIGIDVLVGIGDKAEEARLRAQTAGKPALLCDINCPQTALDGIDATIPYTWGLFGKNNKDKEMAFLRHYNLSFVYDAGNEKIADYIAPLVFHMLEEFSFHSKYNTNFGYKKQAEFIHEFTQFYLDKMKQLVEAEGFVREDIKGDFNHIIYRYRPNDAEKPFKSIDGRDYDFVIEYHRGKPSEGIYYGIKGEVRQGDLEEQCKKFRKEWPNIFMMDKSKLQKLYDDSRGKDIIFWGYNFQLELTEILNNTFPWKDYLKCYKPTDNMWEKRYWLFWVTLNDDEDIVNVAARAVKLMARTFKRCIVNNNKYKKPDAKKNDTKTPKLQMTSFTNEAFDELTIKIEKGKRRMTINDFIKKLKEDQLIEEDERYECCYILKKGKDNIVSFAQTVESIIKEDDPKSSVPWGMVDRVFLPYTLNPSKDNFKSDLNNFKRKIEEKKK